VSAERPHLALEAGRPRRALAGPLQLEDRRRRVQAQPQHTGAARSGKVPIPATRTSAGGQAAAAAARSGRRVSICAGEVGPRKRRVRWMPSGRTRRIPPSRGGGAAAARRSPGAVGRRARGRRTRARPRARSKRGQAQQAASQHLEGDLRGLEADALAPAGEVIPPPRVPAAPAVATKTRPTGLSAVPRRAGDARDATPTSVRATRIAPSAMAAATSAETAPCVSRRAGSSPVSSTFARFAYVTKARSSTALTPGASVRRADSSPPVHDSARAR